MDELRESLPKKDTYRNFSHGLQAAADYIALRLPEVSGGNMRIVEVGPGVGTFMLLAKALGNEVVGEDLDLGPAPQAVNAYSRIAAYWGLEINYYGFHRYAMGAAYHRKEMDLFHFRGSLDSVVVSMRLPISLCIRLILQRCQLSLAAHGEILIAHNNDGMKRAILAALDDELHKTRFIKVPTDDGFTRLKKEE